MYRSYYTCHLQDPLVLFESAKTESNFNMLTYIPGSVFRGIVAGQLFSSDSKYSDEDINNLIFKGAVQFGDANPVIKDSKESYFVPAVFSIRAKRDAKSYERDDEDEFLYVEANEKSKQNEATSKPKQLRDGYITQVNDQCNAYYYLDKLAFTDSLKSARDRQSGASKDGQMYLYRSLNAGQVFQFTVQSKSKDLLSKIDEFLDGKTFQIGKSKSAEYGGNIKLKKVKEITEQTQSESKEVQYIYAESNLCFLNEFGEYTWQINGEQLTGNSEAKINWEKSAIRFHQYTPFNGHRGTFDAERLIIRKGAVFVLKEKVSIAAEWLQKGVGVHLTEGYGRIMADPPFLIHNVALECIDKPINADDSTNEQSLAETAGNTSNKSELITILEKRYDSRNLRLQMENCVQERLTDEKTKNKLRGKVSKTQWAQVWKETANAANRDQLFDTLFGKDKGILTSGADNVWSYEQINWIKERIYPDRVEDKGKATEEADVLDSKDPKYYEIKLYGLELLAKKMIKNY